jgi:hypothetical protein
VVSTFPRSSHARSNPSCDAVHSIRPLCDPARRLPSPGHEVIRRVTRRHAVTFENGHGCTASRHGAGECVARPSGGVRGDCAAGSTPCRQADRDGPGRGVVRLADLPRKVLQVLAGQIEQLEGAVTALERQLLAGTGAALSASGWRPSPASGRSSPRRLPPGSWSRAPSAAGASSRRGWAWCPGRIPPAAKSAWAAYLKRGNQYLRRLLIKLTVPAPICCARRRPMPIHE